MTTAVRLLIVLLLGGASFGTLDEMAPPRTPLDAPTAQTPPPPQPESLQVFRGATTLVPVDIRVRDRSGKPVTDLTQSDFTILENGVPQTIRHFSTQAYTPETPTPGAAPPVRAASPGTIDPQNRRIFLIVLGRGRLQPPAKGVDGMIHFVNERLMPQDLVAVLAWNRATDFTTDHATIAELLERFKRAHEGIEAKLKLALSGLAAVYGSKDMPPVLQHDIDAVFGGPGARGVRSIQPGLSPSAARMTDDTRQTTDLLLTSPNSDAAQSLGMSFDEFVNAGAQTTQDLGNLYMGVEYLRHLEGEKHLVFVSESGLMLPRAEDDKDLASTAADARVVIDYIHTSGTPISAAQSSYSAANKTAPSVRAPAARVVTPPNMWIFETARTLADLTGGKFYAGQFPNAAADMDDIDQASRFEYILGYYSSNPRMDGKYRKIVARVNRPGVTVQYRHGYFANAALAPFDLQREVTYSRVAAAASYPNAVSDIKVQATASMPKTVGAPSEVRLKITIDPAHLAFIKRDGRNVNSFELAIFCLNDRDVLVGDTWKTVELTVTDDRMQARMREGVNVATTIPVSAPAKNVKIVVYDHDADLVGSAIVKVQ